MDIQRRIFLLLWLTLKYISVFLSSRLYMSAHGGGIHEVAIHSILCTAPHGVSVNSFINARLTFTSTIPRYVKHESKAGIQGCLSVLSKLAKSNSADGQW